MINLPADEIFAYVSNFENLVEWSGAVISVRKTSPGALDVGARVESTIRFLGKWLDMTYEIVEYEPCRYLAFKSISGVAPCFFCYQFEPVEGGRTKFSPEALIDLTGTILGLAESVAKNAVRRQIKHDLLMLKDLLEARAAICRSGG
jgi:uncharacterized membrane protein